VSTPGGLAEAEVAAWRSAATRWLTGVTSIRSESDIVGHSVLAETGQQWGSSLHSGQSDSSPLRGPTNSPPEADCNRHLRPVETATPWPPLPSRQARRNRR
jgi:hypothetical protein